MKLAKEHVNEVENLLELCGDELYGLVGVEPRTGHSRIRVERTIWTSPVHIKVCVDEGPVGNVRTVEMLVIDETQEGLWGRKADMPPQEWNRGLLRLLRGVLMEEIRGEGEDA